jgi:hypothetical protein
MGGRVPSLNWRAALKSNRGSRTKWVLLTSATPKRCHLVSHHLRRHHHASGILTERYEYTPYGQRTVYFSAGVNDPTAHAATVISRRVSLAGSVTAPYGVNLRPPGPDA